MFIGETIIGPVQVPLGRQQLRVGKVRKLDMENGTGRVSESNERTDDICSCLPFNFDADTIFLLQQTTLIIQVVCPFFDIGRRYLVNYVRLYRRAVNFGFRVDVFREILHCLDECLFHIAFAGFHCVLVFPIHSPRQGMFSQHHFRMVGEILVDIGRAVLCGNLFQGFPRLHSERSPCRIVVIVPQYAIRVCLDRFSRQAFAQKQHIGNHFGSGIFLECGLRQSDCPHKVGLLGEIDPGSVIGLVHGITGRNQRHDSARPEDVHALGKKVIVEGELVFGVFRVGGYLDIRKRRIADNQVVEAFRHGELGEVRMTGVLGGIEKFCDACGDWVQLYGCEAGTGMEFRRRKPEKQTDAGAGFQYAPLGEAETPRGLPDATNDAGGGIVRVQG